MKMFLKIESATSLIQRYQLFERLFVLMLRSLALKLFEKRPQLMDVVQ